MDKRTALILHLSDQFLKKFDSNEKKIQLVVYIRHIQCIKYKHIQNITKIVLYIESGTFPSRLRIGQLLSNRGGGWLNAQTLVLLFSEMNSTCLPHRQLILGWQRLIPSENRQRAMEKMGYQLQVKQQLPISTAGTSQLNSMSPRSDSLFPLGSVSCAPTLENTSFLILKVPGWLGVMGTRGK